MKKVLWTFSTVAVSVFCLGLACPTIEPPPPPPLAAPAIDSLILSGYDPLRNEHGEYIKIFWSPPVSETGSAQSFTLLRKVQDDSSFDVFDLSQTIPGDTLTFYDDLSIIGFPTEFYDTLAYRIFAVDSLHRSGDTSGAVFVMLAPQPTFRQFNQSTWSFNWSVLGILGAIESCIEIWNENRSIIWKSTPKIEYGGENQIIPFTTSLPQSLIPLSSGNWYYGIYVKANGAERQSLKVGSFIVQ